MKVPSSPAPENVVRARRGRAPAEAYDCVICGLPVTKPRFFCRLVEGGSVALHPEDEHVYVPDGGDLGSLPVGSDCYRRSGEFRAFCTKA